MKAIRLYLDEALDRGLAKNDSDIARHLGVSRATVSDWRVGRPAPNEDQAAALAALLGKPEVMAECMAARTRRPETRAMWERAAKTLSMAVSLTAVAGVVLLTTATGVEAAPLLGSALAALCVMLSSIAVVRTARGRALLA